MANHNIKILAGSLLHQLCSSYWGAAINWIIAKHIYVISRPGLREVRIGKNCARGLEYGPEAAGRRPYSRSRAQFFPIRTDQGRQITCLFFSSGLL